MEIVVSNNHKEVGIRKARDIENKIIINNKSKTMEPSPNGT